MTTIFKRLASFFATPTTSAILAILVVSGALSIGTYLSVSQGFARALDAANASDSAATLMQGLVDQESAVRGYTITRARAFEDAYRKADSADDREFADIASSLRRLHLNYSNLQSFEKCNYRWDQLARILIHAPSGTAKAKDEQLEGMRLMDRMRAYDGELASMFSLTQADAVAATERILVTAGGISAASILLLGLLAVALEMRNRLSEARLRASVEANARELERSNNALQDFAYVASHDLQEPLRMVSSYTQLLERRYAGKLDSDAHEFIAFAVDGAKRMEALIKDLLSYSRLGADTSVYESVNTRTAFEEAAINLESAAQEANAVIETGTLPTVRGNRSQLTLLFQNLIGNAIKYRGTDAPRIRVGAERIGNKWRFAVSDNGIGIEPQYRERIFKMFQRLHSRGEYSGTGIGLAIVKRIVEAHAGLVWVESQAGAGTTFYFTLPATLAKTQI